MVQINVNKVVHNQPTVGYAPWRGIHAHSTGNNAPAANEIAYLNTKTQTQAGLESGYYTHVVDGQTGEITQVADVNRGAYDIGGSANFNTYAAVELTETATTAEEFKAGYSAYVALLRHLADEAGVGVNVDDQSGPDDPGIMTHWYANQNGWGSSHVDPYNYLNHWGISKGQFRSDLANGVGDIIVNEPDQPVSPSESVANDVDYMRQFGYVIWNGKDFAVDDCGYINGMWQVISNELGGLQPTPTTSDTEWYNNGVPMSVVDWTDGTDQNSTRGTRFKFQQDRMDIVDYDQPSNGIAVMLAGYKVWVDATVARNA